MNPEAGNGYNIKFEDLFEEKRGVILADLLKSRL